MQGVIRDLSKIWGAGVFGEGEAATQANKNAAQTDGGKHAFAGESSETADKDALVTAKRLLAEGEDAETVRQITGWFKGMDGKWRFEIDDSGMKWESAGDVRFREDHPEYDEYRKLLDKLCNSPELLTAQEQARLAELDRTWSGELSRLSQRAKNGGARLGDVIRHEELFEAYPFLADIRVEFADIGTASGQLVARSNGETVIRISSNNRVDPRSTLIHEIQHAIQHAEGFAIGSSKEYWEDRLKNGYAEQRKSEEFKKADQQYRDLFDSAPEELKNKIRELNRAKLNYDLDRWDEIEAELYDGPYADMFIAIDNADWDRRRILDHDLNLDAYDLYRNTAGEIEARDVQSRMKYNAEQRRSTPPNLGDENTVFVDDRNNASLSETDPEILHLKDQITAAQDELNNMQPVADVKAPTQYSKRQSDKTAWAENALKKHGKYIDRQGFGKIKLGDRIEKGMKYARTDADRAAFLAIPAVLKRGIEIGHHAQHKGGKVTSKQNVESWTFAAPVTINGVTGNMGVIVQRTTGLFYKAHKVLMPDGSAFLLSENEDAESGRAQGASDNGRLAGPTDSASKIIIAGEERKDNTQNGKLSVKEESTRFSLKDEEAVTDRELLANTLASLARNPAEERRRRDAPDGLLILVLGFEYQRDEEPCDDGCAETGGGRGETAGEDAEQALLPHRLAHAPGDQISEPGERHRRPGAGPFSKGAIETEGAEDHPRRHIACEDAGGREPGVIDQHLTD